LTLNQTSSIIFIHLYNTPWHYHWGWGFAFLFFCCTIKENKNIYRYMFLVVSTGQRVVLAIFLPFLSNIFMKQPRNLCYSPLLFCMTHNDLHTLIGDPILSCCIFNRKWPQQKQFLPTFGNIVFCEAKAL